AARLHAPQAEGNPGRCGGRRGLSGRARVLAAAVRVSPDRRPARAAARSSDALEVRMLWLERTPIWLIGFLILIGLIVAEQLGYAARRLTVSRGGPEPSNESVGYIVTGALALLGLLVAFTFSAASDRYDTRRQLVVEEANALGTTYLRAQALDPAPRAALSPLISQYAHARDRWLQAGEDAAQIARAQAETEALQDRIWAATVADIRANPTATINPSLLQTTNDMFDVSASIRAAFDGRLPISILRAMIAYALIA